MRTTIIKATRNVLEDVIIVESMVTWGRIVSDYMIFHNTSVDRIQKEKR